METSDSEYFESADEEFFSGDEIQTNNESSESITNIEKLQNLVINKDLVNSHRIEDSGDEEQCEKQFVMDDLICDGSNIKKKHVEVEGNAHIEKLDLEYMLDTEIKNIPEIDSITYKPNQYNNSRLDVPIQPHEEKDVHDSSKNTNRNEGSYVGDIEESKHADNSRKLIQEIKKSRVDDIITNKCETKLYTHRKVGETNMNMWEDDSWDIDNDDIDQEVSCAPNEYSSSIQRETMNSSNIYEMKGKYIQGLDKHLESQQETSDTQNPNIQLKQLKEDSENMWNNDDWEPLEEFEDQQSVQPAPQKIKSESQHSTSDAWNSWGNWGVSSILTTATQGVSTFTNHVSQSLNTIVDTSLGIPNPQELARAHKREEEELKAKIRENVMQDPGNSNTDTIGFGLGNLGNLVYGVSNITKFVEITGNKVISGGLDTLETIGKKTMEVLQDGDPGLKKKRQFLKLEQEKPILSQVLREAKEKAEQENQLYQQKHITRRKNYETLFDDHHGLVHLEALEMLSKQCDIKLKNLTETCDEKSLIDLQETLEQVKELCELPDEDEEEQSTIVEIQEKLQSAVKEINIGISYDKLLSTWEDTETWLNDVDPNIYDENELHQQAIETLAQLTAIAVEQFHKAGELLLIKEHHSTADEADSLVQLTTTLTSLIGIVAGKFSDKLNIKASEKSSKEDINGLITNVFFEAANSSSYIQDAFQLLIPVLQVGAV